jgi:hypothetical protein
LVQVGGTGSHRGNKNVSFKYGVSYNHDKGTRAAFLSGIGETVTAANAAGAAV